MGKYFSLLVGAGFAALLYDPFPALAATAPDLGQAKSFAVLGGSAVTNTGSSIITGDLGVSPGSAVTGFPPGVVVSGTIHAADAVAAAAQNSVTTAYNDLASQACNQDLTGQDLGGQTLTAGVYCFTSSAQLTGTLTLNAQGNANAVFIFKIGSTLTTASGSSVVVINGGSLCNVFWQVGSSATLGTNTSFTGNILALTSITLTTGASVTGRTLARNGAVTLDGNAVTVTCAAGPPPAVCPTITLSPATLPNGTVGVAYLQTIVGSGGTAPYVFGVTAGALPGGLTLTPAGVLAGTPTTNGTFTFTIRGTDANGCFASVAYTIVIAAAPTPPAVCPTITLSPATLPNGTVGVAYLQTIVGSGGTAPYVFGVTAGALPGGLTLTSAGVLSGTPLTNGTSTFTIRGTDANGCFKELSYTIVMVAAPPPPPPPAVCLPITPTLPEAVGPILTLHEVSTCGILGGQNSYILTADLKATGTCLTIVSNGVSLDLNGHSISGVAGAGAGIVAVSPGNNMTIKGPGIIHDFGFCLVLGNYALVQDVLVYNCNNVGINLGNASKCVDCRVHDVRGGEVDGIGIQMGLGCLLESSIVETSDCGAVVGSDCKVWDLVVDTVVKAGLTVSAGSSVARTVISHFHDGPGLVYNCAPIPGASGCQDSSNSVSLTTGGGDAIGILSTGNVTTDCATNVLGTRYPGVPVQCAP